MNKIRKYAKEVGHEVVGKFVRKPKLEYIKNFDDGSKRWSGIRTYVDAGGNEYDVGDKWVCIVTFDGAVI